MTPDDALDRLIPVAGYDQDFYQWTQAQAALLRDGAWQALDVVNLLEEIESLGRHERNALVSRFETLLLHLLKWRYQPEKRQRGHSWEDTIREQRRRISRLLSENPSLRPTLATGLAESYAYVRKRAHLQTRLPLTTFPEVCPWTPEQVLENAFWPEEP